MTTPRRWVPLGAAEAPAPTDAPSDEYARFVKENREPAPAAPASDTPAPSAKLSLGQRVAGAVQSAMQPFGEAMAPANEAAMRTLGGHPGSAAATASQAGAGAGRGAINPAAVDPSAPAPRQPAPYRSRVEALDDAVNLVEEGADISQVAASFGRMGIKREDIEQHGIQRGSQVFTPQRLTQPEIEAARTAQGQQPAGSIQASPAPRPRSLGEIATDTGRQLKSGAYNIMGAVPQLIAPDGEAAQFFQDRARTTDRAQSAPMRDRMAIADAAIDEAGQDGLASQLAEAASQYFSDPALAARFVVSNLPSMIPGLAATKVAQAATLARGMTAAKAARNAALAGGAVNATLNAGGARGDAFDDIKRTLMAQGMSEQDATDAALRDSRVVAAIGGIAGAVSGASGLESVVAKSGTAAARGGLAQGAKSFGAETLGEQVEEVAPKVATNVIAGQYDGRDVTKDVGRTIVETAIGSGPGAALAGAGEVAGDPNRQIAGEIRRSVPDVPQSPGMPAGGPNAWEIARSKGFNVEPPLPTDKPSVRRSKAVEMFTELGAMFGIPKKPMDLALQYAETVPADKLPGFFARYAQAIEKRGLVKQPIDVDVLAAIEMGSPAVEPIQQGALAVEAAGLSAPVEASPAAEEAQQPVEPAAPEPAQVQTAVDVAAHDAATSPTNDRAEPTQAQKEAGNYKVGRTRVAGLDIRIENPQGSKRRGVAPDGTPWETEMRAHYGYFAGTEGADGDKLDVFIKPGTAEDWRGPVFVIDQIDPKTGQLDEHKVVMGAADEAEAERLYRSNYDANWQGLGAITRLPLPAFKAWAKSGRLKEPLGDIAGAPQLAPHRKQAPAAQVLPPVATPEAAPAAQATPLQPQDEPNQQEAQPTPTTPQTPQAGADPGSSGQAAPGEQGAGVPGAGSAATDEAARVRAVKRGRQQFNLDPERDTMLQALAKLGGIRRDVVGDRFGLTPEELKHTVSTGKLKAYPFRKTGGMDLDQAVTALAEAGYFDGTPEDEQVGVFEEAIRDEIAGSPRYTSWGEMRRAQDAYNERQADFDPGAEHDTAFDAEAEAEREAIMAEAGLGDELEDHPTEAVEIEAVAQDMATAMRAMGFTEEEIADALAQAADQTDPERQGSRAQDPEVVGRQAQAPPATGNAAPRPADRAGGDAAAAGRNVVPSESTKGNQEGLTLSAQSEQDLRDKASREAVATKEEAAKRAAEQERLRREADERDTKARADATVDDFQLGQSADQQMSGMGDLFATNLRTAAGDTEEVRQAKADAMKALGDLADIFSKGTRLNMMPEQEQKLLPVLTRLFDAAFRLGYLKFKDAARFALEQIRAALGDDVADQITLEHLQGGYIGMSGRYKEQGADTVMAVAGVASIQDITDNPPEENGNDAPSTIDDLESDRPDAAGGERVLEGADGDGSAAADQGPGEARDRPGAQGRGRGGDAGVPAGGTPAARDGGDQPVRGSAGKPGSSLVPAGSDVDQRGGGFGDNGVPVETVSADATRRSAQDGLAQGLTNRAQREAPTQVKLGDIDNIRSTLPALLPGQQDDVRKAEERFAKPNGYGILFTNGTGTGKTFTGLGVVKRMALQGKENILLVAPSDKVIEDWINSGKVLGLNISKLASTKDAGQGIVITTYANLGDNMVLGDRRWDGAVLDEAHYLMSSKDGEVTNALKALRAITFHPDGVSDLAAMRNRELGAKVKDLSDRIAGLQKTLGTNDDLTWEVRSSYEQDIKTLEKELAPLSDQLKEANGRVREEVFTNQEGKRPRVTFLSATPWAYVQALDWSNGYLFEFDEGKKEDRASGTGGRAYNEGSNRQQFYMQHFGYRMRYNKLTRPESKVDVGLMERQFNAWLRQQGVLSRRALDVAADYDRRFILLESAIGTRIDEALTWLGERAYGNKEAGIQGSKAFESVSSAINDKFDYLSRRYLLEAIKATEVIPIVRQHLAKGRKVVVFHDFKKGGGFNPFAIKSAAPNEAMTPAQLEAFNEALFEFQSTFQDLISYPFERMPSPIQVFSREFPDLLLFNGDVPPKDRRANVAKFQDDATGPRVILVQSAAGKEGISLHDTTGKHQRALINLGQPTAPTTAIQQEGRIYRTGQVTDAILRYLTTGTTWERYAFASQVATRSATVENLAAGEEARALADAFIAAYEEADLFEPGHEGEGTGGKQRDKAAYEALTEFDRAVSFYYGTQKKNAKTKAKEGADYFATPEPLGLKMVEWANVHPGDSVLEPSAGHGAIARWFPQSAKRTAVEPSLELRSRLAMVFGDGGILSGDFESHHIVNKYDAIVMNPPFGSGGRTAVDHLAKAAEHLREGGRIVAIIPTGPAADKKFEKWFYEEDTKPVKPLTTIEYGMGPQELFRGDTIKTRASFAPQGTVSRMNAEGTGVWIKVDGKPGETMVTLQSITAHARTGPRTMTFKPAEGLTLVADLKLPQVTFNRAGTGVATRVVVIEKAREGEVAPAQRNADFTSAESVEDFFKRIRDYSLPNRAKPAPSIEELTAPDPVTAKIEAKREAKVEKATAQKQGAEAAAGAGMEIVEHVTTKGKTLKGVIRTDLTPYQAKQIDPYTFKKDGGYFIRAEHIPKLLGEGDGGVVAQEPSAAYSAREQELLFSGDDAPQTGRLGYETDLFGNPLPSSTGRLAPARPAGARVSGDAQPAATVPDTEAPAGRYRVRTIVGAEVTRKLGIGVIETPQQAAQATAYLYRSAVERLDGIITDSSGKPLAVVGGFKGALSQTSVYPGTLIGEAVRVPGAARVWLSHNHPSGKAELSRADEMLNKTLSAAFDGTGITPMGLLAVAGKKYAHVTANGYDLSAGDIPDPVGSIAVPVIEREQVKDDQAEGFPELTSPTAAKSAAKDFHGAAGGPGLMMLDAQNRVAAWVPIAPNMMGKLRGTGGLTAIYRAISESNANAVIIVHAGELSGRRGDGAATIAQNIGAASRVMDVRVLDIIDVKANRSAAEVGDTLEATSVFSLALHDTPFYSELAAQVERSPMNAGTAGAWQQYLDALAKRGAIKADEMEWTGLREWLQLQPGKISKGDIAAFLDANGVQVQEVTLGGPLGADLPDGWRVRETTEEDDTSFRYALVDEADEARGYGNSRQEAIEDGWDTDEVQDAAPKFERWTVPGGQNYREVLLTLPRRAHPMESEVRALGIAKPLEDVTAKDILDAGGTRDQSHRWMESMTGTTFGNQYKSSHWDQPNVLAHIRVDERTDADGKRVLFVQEVQSDWGQQGKKKGIFNPAEPYEVFNVQTGETVARHSDMRAAAKDAVERGVMFDYKDERTSGFVPPAPFIGKTDAWVGLAIKRVIKMAADEGFDRVAFINGQQAADLFDLSKQVEEIRYRPTGSGRYDITAFDTGMENVIIDEKSVPLSRVEDLVGKEIAQKVEAGDGRQSEDSGTGWRALTGVDLKVGGEGMRTFYDQIVPKVAKEVLRKVGGGQVGVVRFGPGGNIQVKRHSETVWNVTDGGRIIASKDSEESAQATADATRRRLGYSGAMQQVGFDITPAIREKAAQGLPLFSRGPRDGVSGGIGGRLRGVENAISRVDLVDVIDVNLKGWRGLGLDRIVAVDHWTALPQQILDDAKKKGSHAAAVEGVVYRGKVYLVRSNLRDRAHAERVLFHEAWGHMGTRLALAGKPTEALNQLWEKLNGLAGIAKMAKKHQVGDGYTAWDRLQPYVQMATKDQVDRRAKIVEELIAFLAQANDTSALTQFKGYLADLKAAVVALARKLGLNGLADRLDRAGAEFDVLQLVRDARRAIERGTTRDGQAFVLVSRQPVPAYSEASSEPGFSLRADAPVQVPDVIVANPLSATANHADYVAAKAGDVDAAVRLALDLVTPDLVAKVRAAVGEDVIVQPVTAEEAAGRNKIPLAGAKVLAKELGASVGLDVVQGSRAHRTAMDGLGRLFASPEFIGDVVPGGRYLLLDDTLTQGGTFAALASHIEQNGGTVVGAIALTGKQYSATLRLSPDLLSQVRETYSDVEPAFRAATGRGFDSLTQSEARYLAKHKSPDEVRGRIAEAGRQAGGREDGLDPQGPQGLSDDSPSYSLSAQRDSFSLPEFGRTGRFIEAIQDRYNRWKQAIVAVRQQGGVVNESNDFYAAEERYWGIVGAQLDDFKGEVQTFVKAVQSDGLELADVALYAYAKHAGERNARIAEINDAFPDGGSGMTNAQADEILAKARADGVADALERHAAQLHRWSAGTREVLRDNGLISQEEFDAWSAGYEHYVPLRGKPGQAQVRGSGTGQGFDIRGKESFRALGRRSMATDIVEHILQDRTKALIRAGKNEVLRRFTRFVLDNPDPTLWQVNAVKRQRRLVDTPMGEQVIEFDELNDSKAETVAVKDGGQTIYIEVKDAELLQQLKNLHDEAHLPVIVEVLQWANRLLSRMYTSLNPVFTVLNGARDVTAGAINMLGVSGAAGARRMLGNLPDAYREAFNAEVRGRPSALYSEYRTTGGKTGFMDFKDIEGYGKELARMAAESQTWSSVMATEGGWEKAMATWRRSRGTARRLLERIEDVNGAVENATRFAAYKAAREAGKSIAESASIAKNITVNFNRKGAMTPVLSAFFLFFNPAVQGTARMLQALRSRDVQVAMGSAMAGLFGLALANASMGGDDEDDGATYWDKIPDEVKDRNLIIMLPPGGDTGEQVGKHGRYIKIPMPYGYNTFAVIATTAVDMLRNQFNPTAGVTLAKGSARVLKSFVGSWMPASDVAPSLDNPKGIAMAFVPDAIDPIMEPVLNVNSFGRAMYPEGVGYDKQPDSEKVFAGQKGGWSHDLARKLNEATGGSPYHEGAISVTPATINNLVRGYGGGVATFMLSLADMASAQGVARDTPDWHRAPFVRQLYGSVDMVQDQALAYDRLHEIEAATVPLDRAIKAGDRRAAAAIAEDAGGLAKLGPVAKEARQQLTNIRKHEVRVIESERLTDAEKNASLKQWDRERQKVYDRVNRAWARAIEADARHQPE